MSTLLNNDNKNEEDEDLPTPDQKEINAMVTSKQGNENDAIFVPRDKGCSEKIALTFAGTRAEFKRERPSSIDLTQHSNKGLLIK
jgi:hypothetical protein